MWDSPKAKKKHAYRLPVVDYWVYHGPLEMTWDDVPSVYPLRTSSYCELHSGKHTKNY